MRIERICSLAPLLDKEGLGEVVEELRTPLNPPFARGDEERISPLGRGDGEKYPPFTRGDIGG